jgi:hypothetical protein
VEIAARKRDGQEGRGFLEKRAARPIALHPILSFGPNDSEEVLAVLHQPELLKPHADFGEAAPFVRRSAL